MKKKDFNDFKISLNLNIEIDNSLRRITEKIKLLSQLRKTDALSEVSKFLSETDQSIDSLINLDVCDESEE